MTYLGELAGRLGMSFHFGPSGWVDYGPDWHGPQGNALLSRYPLEHAKSILLPRLPTTKQRVLLGARLAAGPARGLTAFVTHLDHALEVTRLSRFRGCSLSWRSTARTSSPAISTRPASMVVIRGICRRRCCV